MISMGSYVIVACHALASPSANSMVQKIIEFAEAATASHVMAHCDEVTSCGCHHGARASPANPHGQVRPKQNQLCKLKKIQVKD